MGDRKRAATGDKAEAGAESLTSESEDINENIFNNNDDDDDGDDELIRVISEGLTQAVSDEVRLLLLSTRVMLRRRQQLRRSVKKARKDQEKE
jgi:hypothetical protein